jgi:hypothetical protein
VGLPLRAAGSAAEALSRPRWPRLTGPLFLVNVASMEGARHRSLRALVAVACFEVAAIGACSSGSSAPSSSSGATTSSTGGSASSSSSTGGAPAISCHPSNPGSCFCESGDASNDAGCGPSVLSPVLCCADPSWPLEGATCICYVFRCSATPDGCTCDPSQPADGGSTCTGTTCCATSDTSDLGPYCTCSTAKGDCANMPGASVAVPSCSLPNLACDPGMQTLTACQ